MKTNNIIKLCAMAGAMWASGALAQDASTAYFMKWSTLQHYQNPAFQPTNKFYIGMPALGSFNLKAGNNCFNLTDIVKNVNVNGEKQTVLFFDKNAKGGIQNFLDNLKDNLNIYEEYRISLIDFGFKLNRGYVTFNLSNRSDVHVSVPRAIPTLAFEGMSEGKTYNFDADELSLNATLYTEVAAGYSQKINDKLTVGGKLKYLYGHANVMSDFSDMKITGSEDEWRISGDGSIYASIPGLEITEDEKGKIDKIDFNDDLKADDYAKSNGNGFAVDLGGTYQILPQLQLSASLTDLGFIRWSKNLHQIDKVRDFRYNGVTYDINDDTTKYWEEYQDMLEDMFEQKKKAKSYTSLLTAKVNLGAEYSVWEDRLGFGVLSKTYINQGYLDEDFRISANFRPFKTISLSASYGMFDGAWNSIGLGMNLNAGPVNLYWMIDHTPLHFAESKDYAIPSKARFLQASLGLNFIFGDPNKKKKEEEKMNELNESQPVLVEEEPSKKEEELARNTPLSPDNKPPRHIEEVKPVVEEPKQEVAEVKPVVEEPKQEVAEVKPVEEEPKQEVAEVKPVVEERKKIEDSQMTAEEKAMKTNTLKGIAYLGNGLMGLKESSYASLDKLAYFMQQHPEYGLNIKSYNNTEAKEEFNYAISREHARLIADYLTVVKGISSDRVSWEGMGSDNAKAKKQTWKQKTELEFYK
ncbi:MAG: OmpA family protein [Bacteroidales bacterium]|nr:OmpA family protein [Candidatus Physcocola equi]